MSTKKCNKSGTLTPPLPIKWWRSNEVKLVVLDKGLSRLKPAFEDAGIEVITIRSRCTNEVLTGGFLAWRIFVTTRPDGFKEDGAIYEYGIVSLRKLREIDLNPTRQNKIVKMVNKTVGKYGLWEQGTKFFLELHDNGNHVLEELF